MPGVKKIILVVFTVAIGSRAFASSQEDLMRRMGFSDAQIGESAAAHSATAEKLERTGPKNDPQKASLGMPNELDITDGYSLLRGLAAIDRFPDDPQMKVEDEWRAMKTIGYLRGWVGSSKIFVLLEKSPEMVDLPKDGFQL